MAKEPSDLKAKLKKSDPIVRAYVAELGKRNAKRQRQIVALEADKVERDGRITALQKEMKENRPEVHLNIDTGRPNFEQMDDKMLMDKLRAFAPKLIEWGPELGLKIERA